MLKFFSLALAATTFRRLAIAAHRVPGAKHLGTRHVDFEQRTPPLLYASFFNYRQLPVERLQDLRAQLLQDLGRLGVLGRIYLAAEGINAAMSIPSANLGGAQAVITKLFSGCVIGTYGHHEDSGSSAPFWNLHVKVRRYLVRDGLPEGSVDVFTGTTAQEVEPEEWHRLVSMEDESSVILDCRNRYESAVGVFAGAKRILSHSYDETWRLLPPLLPPPTSAKNILIYCTGGIRCVKVGAFLTQRQQYHPGQVLSLKGGINAYLNWVETTPTAPTSRFVGRNMTFDGALATGLRRNSKAQQQVLGKCKSCDTQSTDIFVNCKNSLCHSLFLQCKDCSGRTRETCSSVCQEVAQLPPELCLEFRNRVHSSPMWREWMREKHAERQAPYLDSGITIAKAREDLFRTELNSLYIEFPALAPERHAKPM